MKAPATLDEYLAGLREDQRAALLDLRRQILAAAPGAQDCISYGMPAFRRGGVLVWMGATRKHCALYPGGQVEAFKDDLEGFDTSKDTIRFQPSRPLPGDLVRRIVTRRLEQIEAKAAQRAKAKLS
ncbi:MAG: iron chaperone [Caulobacterales bacterium]